MNSESVYCAGGKQVLHTAKKLPWFTYICLKHNTMQHAMRLFKCKFYFMGCHMFLQSPLGMGQHPYVITPLNTWIWVGMVKKKACLCSQPKCRIKLQIFNTRGKIWHKILQDNGRLRVQRDRPPMLLCSGNKHSQLSAVSFSSEYSMEFWPNMILSLFTGRYSQKTCSEDTKHIKTNILDNLVFKPLKWYWLYNKWILWFCQNNS